MNTLSSNQTKQWLKNSNHPVARFLLKHLKMVRLFEVPAPRFITAPLYASYGGLRGSIEALARIFIWTPMLKGRLNNVGKNLYLYGGLPFISGALDVSLGNNCRLSGQTTFSGRTCSKNLPILTVGNNVDIGWMTTIAVGNRVVIGNNVRIAGRALLAGYPGHPVYAAARAAGLPDNDNQVGDIILEDDVWLATGVSVMAGSHIGRGTIVAAGSVVTKDLPANVLAGGIPAQVIHSLNTTKHPKGG